MAPDTRPLLTIPNIAQRSKVSTKTVRRWIKSGDLIAYKLGGQLRISEEDWNLFLRIRRGANLADDGDHK